MSDARTGVLELTLGDSYIGSAYSPQVEVTDTATGHEVAITYMSPEGIVTERFDVADGEQGPQGPAGYSPTVTITDTPTGHTVTITDAQGPHSYDVPNYAQEEQERQQAWDALSGEVTDAISDAETATSAASTAAQSATSAASSANTAAQAATTAASSANTAASSANAAATAANSAATAAGTAADAATTAAGDATDAASAANTAAQAAQEAATEVAPEVAWLWGNQLTGEVTGDLLTAADAYAAPPMALTVDGKSTQDGTPTPESPVEIVSLEQLRLIFAGKNLLPIVNSETKNGITFTTNADGSTTLNGTASASTDHYYIGTLTQYVPMSAGSYTLFGCTQGAPNTYQIYMVVRHADETTTVYTQATRPISVTLVNGDSVRVFVRVLSGANVSATIYQQLERGSTATPYQPYSSTESVLLNLTQALRSLPDGTKDTMTLTYLRPSTRDGWAWYSRELTALVGETTTAATDGITGTVGVDVMSTTGEIADGPTVLYKLATPVTTQLDPIELPVLPAPECTVCADPTTGLTMEYVRDTNLVIQALENAYADLATS